MAAQRPPRGAPTFPERRAPILHAPAARTEDRPMLTLDHDPAWRDRVARTPWLRDGYEAGFFCELVVSQM